MNEPPRRQGRQEPDRDTDALANLIIGAAIEVHRHLGPGFLESVYEEALAIELADRGVVFQRQAMIGVDYKGRRVGKARIDMMFGDRLLLELKAIEELAAIHTAQVISYLKATRCHVGLLINFNVPALKTGIRRVVLSER